MNNLLNESDSHYLLTNAQAMLCEQAEYNLFAMLKPKLMKDGNQWCVLYGEDLQTGIAGFGNTPYNAILDFNSQWHKN